MQISLNNGATYITAAEAAPEIDRLQLWPTVYDMMDDATREAVNLQKAPCSDAEFLTSYLAAAPDDLIIG